MGKTRRIDDLQIDQDLALQRRIWAAQRTGWALMALAAAASLTGLLGGSGPLSSATAGRADSGVWVEYERFARLHAPADIIVNLRPSGAEPEFSIDRALLESLDIKSILPEPERVEAGPREHRYIFAPGPPGAGPVRITLRVEAARMGRRTGLIRAGGATAEVSRLIYP